MSKLKSLSLKDYIEIKKQEYTLLKIIPLKNNKNNNTDKLALLINEMSLNLKDKIKKENNKLIIKMEDPKCSYLINIRKNNVSFYFIIPTFFYTRFKAKIKETWRGVELKEVDSLPTDFNNSTSFKLQYNLDEHLSLNTDKRNNHLLNANLSLVNILEDDENISIFYNFIPTPRRMLQFFRHKSREVLSKFESGENLVLNKSIIDFLKIIGKELLEISMIPTKNNTSELFYKLKKEISNCTRKKQNSDLIQTQIVVCSSSSNLKREIELCKSTINTFSAIDNDNKLIGKKLKKHFNPYSSKIQGASTLKTSTLECQNFISIANTDTIKTCPVVEHNKISESQIPKCLENGVIKIGKVKIKDTTKTAYFSKDEQLQIMSRYLLGAGGSGKSHKMISMAKDIINANDRGLIILDYIQDCNLSNAIKEFTPKDRLIEIDCSNPNQLQSFSFNELTFSENTDNIEKLNIAMQKASQVQLFLDSINVDSELTPRMVRYLYAGSIVTFYNNINASLKEVCDILQNPYKRANLISSLNELDKKLLSDEIDALNTLTKEDKKKETLENADSKIDGIIDRISWLSSTNVYTKLSYNKNAKDNIDFIDSIKNNKIILIKIPEDKFPNRNIRNIIATFFLNKIWLAKQQIGSNNNLTEIFIDEIHQCYNCQILLEKILVEHRKYKLIPTIALHYLDQCTPSLKNSILNSGGSFIILSGADPKAFKDLKAHFEKEGYQEEDIAELERYNALCLIKNENTNYSAFVANLKEG